MPEESAPRGPDSGVVAGVEGGSPRLPRLVTPALLRSWPLPEPDGTKYSRGLALVVGGSCSTPGGAILAGVSALRMGAGRLHLATAEGVATQVAVAVPECGTTGLPQDGSGAVTGRTAGSCSSGSCRERMRCSSGPDSPTPRARPGSSTRSSGCCRRAPPSSSTRSRRRYCRTSRTRSPAHSLLQAPAHPQLQRAGPARRPGHAGRGRRRGCCSGRGAAVRRGGELRQLDRRRGRCLAGHDR